MKILHFKTSWYVFSVKSEANPEYDHHHCNFLLLQNFLSRQLTRNGSKTSMLEIKRDAWEFLHGNIFKTWQNTHIASCLVPQHTQSQRKQKCTNLRAIHTNTFLLSSIVLCIFLKKYWLSTHKIISLSSMDQHLCLTNSNIRPYLSVDS